MAKDLEKEVLEGTSKLDEKRKAAQEKKDELLVRIGELKEKILEEKDEKAKKALRKERDELIRQRDGIVITDKKVKIPMPSKKKKIITACVAVVVVLALLFTYVATGLAKHGFIATTGAPQKALNAFVLTDADGVKHSIKVDVYNYYFANYYFNLQSAKQQYAQYGLDITGTDMDVDFDLELAKQKKTDENGNVITWLEYVQNKVIDSIKNDYVYYYAAVKANNGKEPEITEDQQKELDELIETYTGYAKQNGFDLDAFLSTKLGYGVTSDTVKTVARVQYIAENFKKDYEFSDEEYDAYLNEHKDELMGVDVKLFEASSEDDAKAFVKALKKDGSNFAELASQYSATEWDKIANADDNEITRYNLTRTNFTALQMAIATAEEEEHEEGEEHEHTYPGLDWVYSDKRKAGDVKRQSTSVVYIVKPAYLSDKKTVNVRHILIKPEKKAKDKTEETEETEETDETEKTEETESEPEKITNTDANKKQRAAALKKAEEILKEFNDGDKTEDSFAELAKQYTDDSNGEQGGLYENVTTNQMVPTFNNWIFADGRKTGDVEIVPTEFGYHIIYFVSENDMPVWKASAKTALAADGTESSLKALTDKASIDKSFLGSRYFITDLDLN